MPTRFTEANIIHNPFTWFGIWTPEGWQVHKKRWGNATRRTMRLNGDGLTTVFPGALRHHSSGSVAWDDDLHVKDDPFTDEGIYPCDPRVEYPAGNARWAVSHTLLCHPVADHNLYTHEYRWDMRSGDLHTHFRRHVVREEAITEGLDGKLVRVSGRPISSAIEGNRQWRLNCSAVRGVWETPEKSGRNLYTRRILQKLTMTNGVYIRTPHAPVVQCWGIWNTLDGDDLGDLFSPDTGVAPDPAAAAGRLEIPWDLPRLALIRPTYRRVYSDVYESEVSLPGQEFATVEASQVEQVRARAGSTFGAGKVGFAHGEQTGQWARGYAGFDPCYDLNSDGTIDGRDAELCAKHVGRKVRINHYLNAYFGGDWVSTGVLLAPHHRGGTEAIVDYEYGGGYDPDAGLIKLLDSPGPGRKVWVEYFYDAPAEPGNGNIVVHTFEEEGRPDKAE